ncbi:hypothetical protein VC83_06004 [Pseudogymnoascus destructans]|uniref:CFEM domain-containing protein n=2 Tax=Pseudogymnoascus destructans TaxID=655981 RepID=L8FV04_PSED2|nr:uncharacterized protein VC83_06004 [Pseudogymnoascus destructans]ELR04313.1 hypothetical protein GMDG_06702 [Pseudogymnoascus destructans 20631-21]OAF57054.1 hypothetical protein VC83_06004 [Pseudogymnoascus destructans]
MRISNLVVIAALPALSLTQSLNSLATDIPLCALGPLSIAAGEKNCNSDAQCLCKDQTFISSLTKKVEAACSKGDFNKVVTLATNACKSAGVTVDIPVGAAASNSTGSSTDVSGGRSSTVNLVIMVGALGLAMQAVL